MAERPIFIPDKEAPGLVRAISLQIFWHGGFAPSQKKKNIMELHNAAVDAGFSRILEISTKSDEKLGQSLSAFSLKVWCSEIGDIPLECAYQGSKVFEDGGPYTDLYTSTARTAKRDIRLINSGKLTQFEFDETIFPLEPKTVFYDWLYINALFQHLDWLNSLEKYVGFTDIEFNPSKSINCQARSCALFISLSRMGILEDCIESANVFIDLMREHNYIKSFT